jgi:hypothetical protein
MSKTARAGVAAGSSTAAGPVGATGPRNSTVPSAVRAWNSSLTVTDSFASDGLSGRVIFFDPNRTLKPLRVTGKRPPMVFDFDDAILRRQHRGQEGHD